MLVQEDTALSTLQVEGALRGPEIKEFSRRVEMLLRRGDRRILLDLRRLSDIDAAGVGGLVQAFNATNRLGGRLQIANARGRVRRILEVTGILPLLNALPG
jgi:anti-sigma B factor antagonist